MMIIEPSLADYILGGVIAIVVYLFNSKMSKAEECSRHLEKNAIDLAREFNQFRLEYTKDYGEVKAISAEAKGKTSSIEQLSEKQTALTQVIMQNQAQLRERLDGQGEDIKWLRSKVDRIKFLDMHLGDKEE